MERASFIIGSKSYLLAKGMHLIVNEIRNAFVFDIFSDFDDLNHYLQEHNPSVLFLSSDLLYDVDELKLNEIQHLFPKLKWIALEMKAYPLISSLRFSCVIDEHGGKSELSSCLNTIVKEITMQAQDEDDSILSEREQMVLKEVATGLTNKEIAEKLFISQHTVITHRKKITQKLGIKTISGLTVYAIINDLISMEDIEQN